MEETVYNKVKSIFKLRSIATLSEIPCDNLYNHLKNKYKSIGAIEKNHIMEHVQPAMESFCEWLGYDVYFTKKGGQ